MTTLNVARVYLRVSTEDQDLQRQEAIIGNARASGYYVAAVYREKASGARSDRPELLRMIEDLQPGEVVIGVVSRNPRNFRHGREATTGAD
ncbi:recombinase family protein [Pseudomonas amygdali]|uniref:recombinase family protein n=1 Tax=Pseudomonas amygdali TaxID=47877 RepID=UPI002351C672|nr:recombinase family protein [Pseudomonas amygdali]